MKFGPPSNLMSSSDHLSSIVAQKGDLYEMATILVNVVAQLMLRTLSGGASGKVN